MARRKKRSKLKKARKSLKPLRSRKAPKPRRASKDLTRSQALNKLRIEIRDDGIYQGGVRLTKAQVDAIYAPPSEMATKRVKAKHARTTKAILKRAESTRTETIQKIRARLRKQGKLKKLSLLPKHPKPYYHVVHFTRKIKGKSKKFIGIGVQRGKKITLVDERRLTQFSPLGSGIPNSGRIMDACDQIAASLWARKGQTLYVKSVVDGSIGRKSVHIPAYTVIRKDNSLIVSKVGPRAKREKIDAVSYLIFKSIIREIRALRLTPSSPKHRRRADPDTKRRKYYDSPGADVKRFYVGQVRFFISE